MIRDMKRYRVTADLSESERNALDALCVGDYRPPSEQLRWLVVTEAKRRGLLTNEERHSGAALTLPAGSGAAVLQA
jgi:hypothetical protein